MVGYFARYLSERRADPRDDVMTELALAKSPDGSMPDVIEPAKAAMFLFAAGQDTSAKLLGNSMHYLAEHPEMQAQLELNASFEESIGNSPRPNHCQYSARLVL